MSEHKQVTDQELQEIFGRCELATVGPWIVDRNFRTEIINDFHYCIAETGNQNIDELNEYDAEFIATAREDVPRLVAEVKRLRQVLSFYADKEMWEPGECGDPVAEIDRGEVARKNWGLDT